MTKSIPVRFNHIAFTVPREVLSGKSRNVLTEFFTEVFGFKERTRYSKEGEMLLFMAGGVDQFIIFFGHENPSHGNPPLDHFGMAVSSLDELKTLLARAKEFKKSHPNSIELKDYSVQRSDDVIPHNLHKFYTLIGAPFMLEVQYYENL